VWLPPEITQSCTILWVDSLARPGRFIPESLHFFGFDNTVCLIDRDYLFTEQLWNLVPYANNRPYPAIIRRFREVLKERLWLRPTITMEIYFNAKGSHSSSVHYEYGGNSQCVHDSFSIL
jgi:hypothetical protein